MKRRSRWQLLSFAIALLMLLFNVLNPDAVNAEDSALPGAFSVVYNGNGADSGSVPVDSNTYMEGDMVQVLGNTGGLTRNG